MNKTIAALASTAIMCFFFCTDNCLQAQKKESTKKESAKKKEQKQQFPVKMFEEISSKTEDNMVCSPLGVEILYNLLEDGATGKAHKELNSVLTMSHDEACDIVNDMARKPDGDGTEIDMANMIAINEGVAVKDSYKTMARKDYDSEVWTRDMKTPSTLTEINQWISDKTRGLIKKGLDKLDGVSMCAINTIYFNGKWMHEFKKKDTKPTVFTNIDGKKVKVDMMGRRARLSYGQTDWFKMIALPYKGRTGEDSKMKNFALYVFLPLKDNNLDPIRTYLRDNDPGTIRTDMSNYCQERFGFTKHLIDVRLPKFETETKLDIIPMMKNLGVKKIFTLDTNFGNITDAEAEIVKSEQKAVIKVDEEGTEAAAMTEAEIVISGPKVMDREIKYIKFYADYPFIYMLVCEDNNSILFMGQYTKGLIKKDGKWVSDSDVENVEVLEQDGSVHSQLTGKDSVSPTINNEKVDENEVYEIVSEMPEFPGGMDAFLKYINNNIKYPADAREKGIEGRVIVEFIVEKDGTISSPRIMRSLGPSCDKEAMRIIRSMPKWTPGFSNGDPARVRYVTPVMFRLDRRTDQNVSKPSAVNVPR